MFKQVGVATDKADITELADALIYYGSVDVEVESGRLAVLCDEFGFNELCELVDSGNLRLLYSKQQYVIHTANGGVPVHQYIAFSLDKTASGKKVRHPQDAIELALRHRFPGEVRVKKMARELADRVIQRPYYPDIERLATNDLRDTEYRSAAISRIIEDLAPGLIEPGSLIVDFIEMGDNRFVAPIAIDYEAANRIFHRTTDPSHASISEAYILAHLITARNHLLLAAERGDDMWLPSASEALIRLRLGRLAERYLKEGDSIAHFQRVTFDGRSFGDAIKSGSLSARDLVTFVQSEETSKLKRWIADLPSDADVLTEYVKECNGRGLMETLPARAGRLVLFSGAGALADAALSTAGLGMAAGLGLSALDEFLVGRISVGWRPNSWVREARLLLDRR